MLAAREAGISFLDDARYGTAQRVFRGALRRALPRRGMVSRRGRRRQQAVVGVLARADRHAGARRLARAHGARLPRPGICGSAAGGTRGRRCSAGHRLADRVRQAARLGRAQLGARPDRRGGAHRRCPRAARAVRGTAALQPGGARSGGRRRHARRARRSRRECRCVREPRLRGAQRQVRHAGRCRRPDRGRTRGSALRGCSRCRGAARRARGAPGRRAVHAGLCVRARPSGGRERRLRRHATGADRRERRRGRTAETTRPRPSSRELARIGA